jgi:hypothetical protein
MTFAVDVGKIRFNWRGQYDDTATYELNDVVFNQGHSFICVVGPNLDGSAGTLTGEEPTVATYTEPNTGEIISVIPATASPSAPNWNVMTAGLPGVVEDHSMVYHSQNGTWVSLKQPSYVMSSPLGGEFTVYSGDYMPVTKTTGGWEVTKRLHPRIRSCQRTDFTGPLTSSTEQLYTYDLAPVMETALGSSELPETTYAVRIGIMYYHGGTTNHGYMTGDFYQENDSVNLVSYESAHYDDYYNTDWIILDIPWNPLGSTNLMFNGRDLHNTNGSNRYFLSFCGYLYEE